MFIRRIIYKSLNVWPFDNMNTAFVVSGKAGIP